MQIHWFRRDLRLHDNPALEEAARRGPVLPVFVLDPALLEGRWPSANRVHFMMGSLRVLSQELQARGSRLIVRQGRPARVLAELVRETGAECVHWQRDYSPYARRRDAEVAAAVPHREHPGQLIQEPEELGRPYAVFTPFRRRWETLARRRMLPVPRLRAPERWPPGLDLPETRPASELPAPGEPAARDRLRAFLTRLPQYGDRRDLLAAGATSRLSQDLRWGLLSPLEVAEACDLCASFVNELAWRDFYAHLLWHHPRVVRHAFRPALDNVAWQSEHLEAWLEGRTGYPVVDAAMRELRALGWMHNRARMIVASFLTKHLLIDWREGERHFMHWLTDGDLASNNGGWQWAASTGTDPQPYFRIFNPTLQGKKNDPQGDYVRRWVPELRAVEARQIHEPAADVRRQVGYPEPIVDHAEARLRALRAYERALGK